MSKTDSTSVMKEIVKAANEEFGDGALMIPELGDPILEEKVEVISTGYKPLDDALGVAGLPRGRVVEVYGQEASGKTSLVLQVIREAQAMGLRCAFIDTEHALSRERATDLGVDFSKIAISQPDSAEQALEVLCFLVDTGAFGVIALDSVAALSPRAELEGEITDANMGLIARMMGKTLRKITHSVHKHKILVIFINQLRAKLGGFGFIPQETTTGGNALKFYASVRIDLRKTGTNKSGEKITSSNHKITVKKNKMAIPMEVVEAKLGKAGFFE